MKNTILTFLALAGLALACERSPRAPALDATAAGAGAGGGAGGAGASGGGAGTGGAGGGGAGGRDAAADVGPQQDAPRPPVDAPARDAAADDVIGGIRTPGGPCGQDCMALFRQYADGITRAWSCVPGVPGQCVNKASVELGCNTCRTWVNQTTEIAGLAARWARECSGCDFFLAPGRCHPSICANLEIPTCQALPSGGGTCVNMLRERPCPPEAKTDVPCDPDKYDYCDRQGMGIRVCTCYPHEKFWRCY